MLTLKFFAPLLVFLGIVGIGLLLKRILPAGTTINLSKKKLVVGALVGGAILIALITIIIVFLVLKR